MKKMVNAIIPFMLLGGPAVASSQRSISRIIAKKAFVQTVEAKQTLKKSYEDPFGSFSSTTQNRKISKTDTEDVLAFLKGENLLDSTTLIDTTISGEIDGEFRKEFASSTYCNTTYNMCIIGGISDDTKSCTQDSDCVADSDTTDPVFENTTPSVNSKTADTIVLNVDINESGTVYAIATDNDSAVDATPAQVKAGVNYEDGVVVSNSNVALNSGDFNGTITLSGLNPNHPYKLMLIAEDIAGNIQDTISSLTVTTLNTDTDISISHGDTVDENTTPSISSIATTLEQKADLFDFNITDGGTADGISTNVAEIKFTIQGTDTEKLLWVLNGPGVDNAYGEYDSNTNKLTFNGGINISIPDGESANYVLSAYFKNPTGLTDNSQFEITLDSDDIVLEANHTQIAEDQAFLSNAGKAKVEVEAVQFIFKKKETAPADPFPA